VRTADFDYELPPGLIAQAPAEPRDSARLMLVDRGTGAVTDYVVADLPSLLRRGDLLVVNDTRVMAARLRGSWADTGGAVEALLVREVAEREWDTLFRPARGARPGRPLDLRIGGGTVRAEVAARELETVRLRFAAGFDPATAGEVPLPPYIRGYGGPAERYQTVYADRARSAAAPTAGLHFTTGLLAELKGAGVGLAKVSLDVGPGTFRPVTAEHPRDHKMHSEHVEVPTAAAESVSATRAAGGRVVAVGTTVVRTLEHVARVRGRVEAYEGDTNLLILPGDRFLVVDALLTNFHLPRSTLLMLVAAIAGRELALEAYARAVSARYRFFSFGDAMLIV
jgi:S-adenosylmethionine:tRNA ribosyltransferase-isomerase